MRRSLTRLQRYAALILDQRDGDGRPYIERAAAASMTTMEIIERFESLTQEDHIVPVAVARDIGWDKDRINHPANIQIISPQGGQGHIEKTGRDVTEIAKSKRIAKKHAEHEANRRRMLQPDTPPAQAPTKRKQKIKNRGFRKAPDGMTYDWATRRWIKDGA